MSVSRIENFNLAHRNFISGIYGPCTNDVFIDDDLHVCNSMQILYRSFKKQGYYVVFYSTAADRGFWSFGEDDLGAFLGEKRHDDTQEHYVSKANSPFGKARAKRAQASSQSVAGSDGHKSHYNSIDVKAFKGHPERTYFASHNNIDTPFQKIKEACLQDIKAVVVFSNAMNDNYENEDIATTLSDIKRDYSYNKTALKIVLYFDNASDDKNLFRDARGLKCKFFQDALVGVVDEHGVFDHPAELYCLQGPSYDEFRNLLNRKRICDGVSNTLSPTAIERLSVILCQQTNPANKGLKDIDVERLDTYQNMDKRSIEKRISSISDFDSWKKLRSLPGTESIREQFEKYIDDFRYSIENPEEARFRPHMVFLGNPGTGKTTIARIFSDILREEGLLSRGHLVSAKVSDLEAGYVGQTRIKTQALCDKARGGVLFIDEAYGLMGTGREQHVDYGQEAIEVLIQFMEERDSLVILAGYELEMENLLKNGNTGFESRIEETSKFYFNDYPAEVLFEIFKSKIGKREMDTEFETNIKLVISTMFRSRNMRWGNAREMEKLARRVLSQQRQNKNTGVLVVNDIPQELLRMINPELSFDEVMSEINQLVGLQSVKKELKRLLNRVKGSRMRALQSDSPQTYLEDMNYLFLGNPGTGKTTVAKMMGNILFQAGILSSSEISKKTVGSIVGGIVGQTSKNIDSMFKDDAGKVIFIDEAYGFLTQGSEGTNAINAICDNVLDPRFKGRQAIILAGYTDEMGKLINQNPGIPSRFRHKFIFEDYTNPELWSILCDMTQKQGMKFSRVSECKELAYRWFDEKRASAKERFANARECEELLETLLSNIEPRVSMHPEKAKDPEYIYTFTPEDFPHFEELENAVQSDSSEEEHRQENEELKDLVSINLNQENPLFRANEIVHCNNSVGLLSGKAGKGTAFIISLRDRLIITADHVINNNSEFRFYMKELKWNSMAQVVWRNPVIDIAILEVDTLPDDARYLELESNELSGDDYLVKEVLHAGYLHGTDVANTPSIDLKRINNHVKNVAVGNNLFDVYYTDVVAQSGCSGGPLIMKDGFRVIGVMHGGLTTVNGLCAFSDIQQLFHQNSLKINQ